MTAGSGPNEYKPKREPGATKQTMAQVTKLVAVLLSAAFAILMVVAVVDAAQPPNSAQCFSLNDYLMTQSNGLSASAYSSVSPDADAQDDGDPTTPSVSCPSGQVPRQGCVTTDSNDPAVGTGGCDSWSKPYYWTDADLQDTVPGMAPDASNPVNGMPRNVFLLVCTDGSGADEGQPVSAVRTGKPFKDGSYLYNVTCSSGYKTLTEY
jgi:hypothetical protein